MCNEALTLAAAAQLWAFTKMFQIMTDHVFDLTILFEGRIAGGRAGSGIKMALEQYWTWLPTGIQTKGIKGKENAGKHQRHRSKLLANTQTWCAPTTLCTPHKPTHVIDPYKNADTQTPSDGHIYNNKSLYYKEIKSQVHLAIWASQTKFPRLFLVNDWGQHHHINIILCSLPFLSEWLLSASAYLRRDGKGTEERKSILYLTTKHKPNEKQLEFAGCSINWTASSAWLLWIVTAKHYSTMA